MLSALLLSGKFAGTQHVFFSSDDLGKRTKEAVDGAQALIAEVSSRYPDEEPADPPAPPPSPTPAAAPPPASTSTSEPASLEAPTAETTVAGGIDLSGLSGAPTPAAPTVADAGQPAPDGSVATEGTDGH